MAFIRYKEIQGDSWLTTISKAMLGATLKELNLAFNTNSKMEFDERFKFSLNSACIDAGHFRLRVSFDYGKRSDEINYMRIFCPVDTDDFTQGDLDDLFSKYGNDFKCLTHTLFNGTREYYYYSFNTRILIYTIDGVHGAGLGPIRISRPPSGPIEKINKFKSQQYRSLKYNFTNPDEFIDPNYTAIWNMPREQVHMLLTNGHSRFPK